VSDVVVVGSCNLDLIVEVTRLPAAGETVRGSDMLIRTGGKGANQALAARRLGAETAFVGAIGDDQFGTMLRDALAAERVDLTGLMTAPGPSGTALILIDGRGENVIAIAAGANGRLTPEHLRLAPASVLLMQLEIPLATCVAAATHAREAGARVVLNAAPAPAGNDPELQQLLKLTDVLVVNEGEARTMANAAGEIAQVARELIAAGPRVVIVTLGAAGALVARGGNTFTIPSHPVEVVDTTGAGDAFCGALAAALAEGRSVAEAVRRGCKAGALATTAVGAQAALPTAADLDDIAMAEA
jgi:ribokinase